MIRIFQICALWAFVGCLAVTSVTTAVARSAAKGHYSVVICGTEGVVQITLDAQGNPTGPMHPCPDCVAAIASALPAGVEQPVRPISISRFVPDLPADAVWSAQVLSPSARGPPLFV